ncbi:MAG: PEGA domain-containing protein, partial [Myxococcaceae bacterium]
EMREALEEVALESGVHVGPSSLGGYVEADEEENSLVSMMGRAAGTTQPGTGARLGAGPAPRTGGYAAYRGKNPSKPGATTVDPPVPSSPRHHTERVEKDAIEARLKRKPLMFVGAGIAATVIAIFAVLIFARPHDVEKPEPVKPLQVAQTTQKTAPLLLPDPTEAMKKDPPKEDTVKVVPQVEQKQVVQVAAKSNPVEKSHPKKVVVASAEEKAPPAQEEAIPEGEGTLRISTDPPDATVFISGSNKGTTPLNMRDVKSGKYLVEIVAKGGRGSCAVKVMPNKTTKVRYDFDQKRCSSDF